MSKATVLGPCCLCEKLVKGSEAAVFEIKGYEEVRSGGGQNHVLRKERLDGRIWHKFCWSEMIREQDGGSQMTL